MRYPVLHRKSPAGLTAIVLVAILMLSGRGVAATTAATATATTSEAAPVKLFRGDAARTGQLDDPGPKGNPVVQWTFKTGGAVESSPAMVDGTVYVGSDDATLNAIDAASGEARWRFATAGAVTSSPAVVNGVVYVGSEGGDVYAVDAATGTQRWQLNTGGTVDSSPVVVGSTVFIGNGPSLFGGSPSALSAIARDTGEMRWSYAIQNPTRSSPATSSRKTISSAATSSRSTARPGRSAGATKPSAGSRRPRR
jgi:outer membrane protein assembly factor BamB